MCTLSYIPTNKGRIINANRDESPLRSAKGLSEFQREGKDFLIAKEPVFGGTNFAVAKNGLLVAVLLNGAFEQHQLSGPFRRSRGLVVLDSLMYSDLFSFANEVDFEDIEPFTLVHFNSGIKEIRWDGDRIHQLEYDPAKPFIIASAQLYNEDARKKRKTWFEDFLKSKSPNRKNLFDFHLNAGDGDPENDLRMNRGGFVKTVSVSQVADGELEREIRHLDLVRMKEETFSFKR